MPSNFKLNCQERLNNYVNKFSKDEKQIDYKALVEDVQAYDYTVDASQVRSAASQKSGFTDAIAWNEPKSIFEDDYVVLD